MSMFSNLKTEGLEEAQDRLGGFQVRPTQMALATVKAAFAGQSAKGAQSVTLCLVLPDGEYNETIYITNRKGENFFLNKQDNSKKVPLPGFTTINDLCLMTSGKPLSEQDTEEKVVLVYDAEASKEMPKSVPMLIDILNQEVSVALLAQIVDKNVLNDSTGVYEPSGETREENVIDKVFHEPSKMTVLEAQHEAEEPVFYHKWIEKNAGQPPRNKSKGAASGGGKSGRPGMTNGGAPQSGGDGARKTGSLFGKK